MKKPPPGEHDNCGNCKFFLEKKSPPPTGSSANTRHGICRLFPANVPKIFWEWCGQHKRHGDQTSAPAVAT